MPESGMGIMKRLATEKMFKGKLSDKEVWASIPSWQLRPIKSRKRVKGVSSTAQRKGVHHDSGSQCGVD